MNKKIMILVFMLIFITFLYLPAFSQETLTITTYYPSPFGNYQELRAQRMAIGATWFNPSSFPWYTGGGPCPAGNICNAALVVEGNVGIGTNPGEKLDVAGFIKTSQGIKFPDGTQQTSSQIERIKRTQSINIKATTGQNIYWYNICPTNYYLSNCGLSTIQIPGWIGDMWTITMPPAGWSFYILHNSEISGPVGSGQMYNGGNNIGACNMWYQISAAVPGYTLAAECIKVK